MKEIIINVRKMIYYNLITYNLIDQVIINNIIQSVHHLSFFDSDLYSFVWTRSQYPFIFQDWEASEWTCIWMTLHKNIIP